MTNNQILTTTVEDNTNPNVSSGTTPCKAANVSNIFFLSQGK